MNEVCELIAQWLSLKTRPNDRRKYSRCPICDSTWWDDQEKHNFTCWVPLLTSAMHSDGEGKSKSKNLDEDLQNCDLLDYGY